MKKAILKAPAKINLTLEILNKREDGFHNIQSIMHTINLFDILTVEYETDFKGIKIKLDGNNPEIPYNEKNLVYKACMAFLKKAKIENFYTKIYMEKNIPTEAGLAGGSSDAVAVLKYLNEIFNNILSDEQMNNICSELGSDLNFCLKGGCCLCTSRGEIVEPLKTVSSPITLIKPKNIGISAKEAYQKYSLLKDKKFWDNSSKLKALIQENKFDKTLIVNDLEKALINDYQEFKEIKQKLPPSVMTGSGSVFYILEPFLPVQLDKAKYDIYENYKLI